jgi:hypothetical protein
MKRRPVMLVIAFTSSGRSTSSRLNDTIAPPPRGLKAISGFLKMAIGSAGSSAPPAPLPALPAFAVVPLPAPPAAPFLPAPGRAGRLSTLAAAPSFGVRRGLSRRVGWASAPALHSSALLDSRVPSASAVHEGRAKGRRAGAQATGAEGSFGEEG